MTWHLLIIILIFLIIDSFSNRDSNNISNSNHIDISAKNNKNNCIITRY